jgi:polar amino acid transport system ATP-binding protein
MTEPVIEALNVCKKFGNDLVLDHVSLQVFPGDVVCVLGPSGSGKTTLLRCLNHLEKPTSGAVFLHGELLGYERRGNHLVELHERRLSLQRREIGIVFQQFNLFPHLTILENLIEAPVGVLRIPKAQAIERAHELLKVVGLQNKASAMPKQLSGGQQQRVAIARALAMEPRLLLFDEPTSALDPELVKEVLDTMRKLADAGTTMVIVTHEIGFAREVSARSVFMDHGRIIEEGTVESLATNPQKARTRDFFSTVL